MKTSYAVAFFALVVISPSLVFAEPAWWTQQKQDCGLPSGLAYNDWVTEGSPCNNAGGGDGAEPPVRSQAEIDEGQKQWHLQVAHDQNEVGNQAFEKGNWADAVAAYERALLHSPDDTVIQDNLAKARERLKQVQDNQNSNANMNKLIQNYSPGTPSASTKKDLDFDDFDKKGSSAKGKKNELDFGSFGDSDTKVVDTRGAQESLPRQAEEIENSPGYGEARKGFQSIADHDFAAAKAWYGQALLKDPHNAALARMVDLCDYTEKAVEKAKLNKAGGLLGKEKEWTGPEAKKMRETIKALYPNVVLPDPKDMELLDVGQNIVVPTSKDMEFLTTLSDENVVLPKDEDMLFLFPGKGPAEEALKVPEAKVDKEYLTNTNSVIARQLGGVGLECLWTGSEKEGIVDMKKAKKLDPNNPDYGLVLKYWGPNN